MMRKNRYWPFQILGGLQLFIAVVAMAGGLSVLANMGSSSLGLTTSFLTFFIPGFILFSINGLGNLIAGAFSLKHHPVAPQIAIGLGLLMLAWILVQVAWLGLSSWLQPAFFIIGFVELGLGCWFWVWREVEQESRFV